MSKGHAYQIAYHISIAYNLEIALPTNWNFDKPIPAFWT
jgi:hypothetical protein